MFLNNKNYIKYIPVCSNCGEPIPKDEYIYLAKVPYEIEINNKIMGRSEDYQVYPRSCKKCGAIFEYVITPNKPQIIDCL